MSVPWIPYDGSWISIGAAAVVTCVVIGIALASAIFYVPILCATIRVKATRNMPPLPPGKIGIPYLGESLDYMRSWSNLHSLDVWYDTRKAKHGGIFKTHILGKPTVVMLGAEANKFILTNEGKLFRNLWPESLRVLIGKHSMTSSQGDDHRRVRRIIHSVLGIENLKKSVARFERLVLQHLDSEWRSGHVIYAHDKLREMALCVATEYFMGLKAGEEFESFMRYYYDLNKGLLSHPLDLPWTVFGKAKIARAAIVAQIAKQIQLRKNSFTKSGEEEENFLDMVLRAQKAGDDFCMSDEEIIDNLLGFLIGGFDTTASALATVLKHLSLSPHVLQRLRKDCKKLRDSKDVGEPLTWNEIKSVKFLSNVVAEGMRIVPPINGGFKEAKIDIPYGGYTIPKGWKQRKPAATIDDLEHVQSGQEMSMKRVLSHQPISVCFQGSGEDFRAYKLGIFTGTCGKVLDHAAIIVGYGSEGGLDYWIVKNSWGLSCGEQVYIRMQRNVKVSQGLCGIALPTKKLSN